MISSHLNSSLRPLVDLTYFEVPITQLQSPLPAIPTLASLSDDELTELLECSKYLHRRLAAGSALSPAPVLAIVHPTSDFSHNFDFPSRDAVRKRLIPSCVADSLSPPPPQLSVETFAKRFCNGEFPERIIFKPDGAGAGNGLLKITRFDSHIEVTTPKIIAPGVWSMPGILQAASSHTITEGASSYSISLPLYAADLASLCHAALTTVYPYESDERFGYTDINSGLVEEYIPLRTVQGSVVEGRYFLIYTGKQMIFGVGRDSDQKIVSSYLKSGHSDWYVNDGTVSSTWPDMHTELIRTWNLECTPTEFNLAMAMYLIDFTDRMISNYGELVSSLDELFERAKQPIAISFTIDVAWSEELIDVSLDSDDGGVVKIPRPIWMECSFTLPRAKYFEG